MSRYLLDALIFGAVMVVCHATGVILGYWMGRNSAERPLISEAQQRSFDQGPGDEPEHDNLFKDAMEGDEDKRIPTLK